MRRRRVPAEVVAWRTMGRGRDVLDDVLVVIWDGIVATAASVSGQANASIAGPTNASVTATTSSGYVTHVTYRIDDSRWSSDDTANLALITVTVT